MIVLIIALILILSALDDWAKEDEFETSEYNAEMRHQELMEVYKRKANNVTKAKRTRMVKEENGTLLAEEVEIEGDFDYEA